MFVPNTLSGGSSAIGMWRGLQQEFANALMEVSNGTNNSSLCGPQGQIASVINSSANEYSLVCVIRCQGTAMWNSQNKHVKASEVRNKPPILNNACALRGLIYLFYFILVDIKALLVSDQWCVSVWRVENFDKLKVRRFDDRFTTCVLLNLIWRTKWHTTWNILDFGESRKQKHRNA